MLISLHWCPPVHKSFVGKQVALIAVNKKRADLAISNSS